MILLDGATLKESIQKGEENSEGKIEQIFVDKAYRGKEHHPVGACVYISGKKILLPQSKNCLKVALELSQLSVI